ncbi:hypothetical protein ACO0M4_29210 [Streptomyces sp. RGM 3693]|uniref:hypothetical protein n=1 Tax=Streptomyces sp. RGM 3693 TaxID=3413284 RepID=UPI003D28E24B
MSADAWTRWRQQVAETLTRHREFPELDRQLNAMHADLKLRAWVDELTDEEVQEMLHGLSACIDAIQGSAGEASELPESTS